MNRADIAVPATAPVIWPLVQIAGDHMNQSDEQDRPDEGGELAGAIIDAFPKATPTSRFEVGAVLLALSSQVDDLACIVYEGASRPGVSDERSQRADRIAEGLEYNLVRAAAVLWQGDGWTDASERVFDQYTAMETRRKIQADLLATGLSGLPAGLLSDGDGKGGAS